MTDKVFKNLALLFIGVVMSFLIVILFGLKKHIRIPTVMEIKSSFDMNTLIENRDRSL